jgi:hypothetical protein
MKLIACVVVSSVLVAGAPGALAEGSETPEIQATLFPATGVIPAGPERHVYRFQISANDPDNPRRGKAFAETLVEPGQTRDVSSGRGKEWEIKGTVTLKENGHVIYQATLLHNGERITSSSAGIKLSSHE